MKGWWQIPFGVACGLLGAGLLLLAISPPRGEPVLLKPPPTAPPMVVHVSGAVANPGVYALPRDCRIRDALEAAGGILPEADLNALNLAALVQDGERVWVPSIPTPAPTKMSAAPPAAGASPEAPAEDEPSTPQPDFPININTASQSDLESLPGIGPVIAQRIIDYRAEHGPFTQIEEIENVSGIGPKTFEKIEDLITVAGP